MHPMLRRAATAVLVLAILQTGCKQVGDPPITPAAPVKNESVASPIKQAIADTLDQNAKMFPPDVSVLDVSVEDKIARIDFNDKFDKLAEMGDTAESQAQKLLRATLAKFESIDNMSVTVEGRSFNSQHTDWFTPFPVRMTDEEAEARSNTEDVDTSTPDDGKLSATEKETR